MGRFWDTFFSDLSQQKPLILLGFRALCDNIGTFLKTILINPRKKCNKYIIYILIEKLLKSVPNAPKAENGGFKGWFFGRKIGKDVIKDVIKDVQFADETFFLVEIIEKEGALDD